MSSDFTMEEEVEAEVVFVAEEVESSEEPPQEDWSSFIITPPEINVKRVQHAKGLYNPGSREIYSKHISRSDSEMFRHSYWNYPSVSDPGIMLALEGPEPVTTYPLDGQDLYLKLCEELNQCPVREFHRNLKKEVIDLRYYCVDPKGVYAMARALKYNQHVKIINLTDNYLNVDACYHFGEIFSTNASLIEINLSGCRLGPEGAKKLMSNLHINRKLQILNLNGNEIGNIGMSYIADAMIKGMDVAELYLNNNNLGSDAADALSEGLEARNNFVVLDLSWNNLFTPISVSRLLIQLSENKFLQDLELSWNSISGSRISQALKTLIIAPSIKLLNLSNNKLNGDDIAIIISNFSKAKSLRTIDFSYNYLTPADAYVILQKMRFVSVKLQNLVLKNIFVNGQFLLLLEQIKRLRYRKNFTVTYGGVITMFKPVGPDPRELVLNRINYLTSRSKKQKLDIALLVLQLLKEDKCMIEINDFTRIIRSYKTRLDNDVINELVDVFLGPQTRKSKFIDIVLLADYIVRKWPDRKLPPTPPPEPEVIAEPPKPPKPKSKGKRKTKKGKK